MPGTSCRNSNTSTSHHPRTATIRYCIFEDSVLPVIQSGQAEFVKPGGGEILEGIEFLSTPGHSLDHMSISLRSKGEEALFAGDVLHHPLQVLFPQLNSVFCESADAARASRRWALDYAAERQAVYFSTHFPELRPGASHGEAAFRVAVSLRAGEVAENMNVLNTSSINPVLGKAVVAEDLMIDSDTPGIQLHLRRKHAAGRQQFSAEKTLLMMHGATYACGSLFDVPLDGYCFSISRPAAVTMSTQLTFVVTGVPRDRPTCKCPLRTMPLSFAQKLRYET